MTIMNPCGEIPLYNVSIIGNTKHLADITLKKLEQFKTSSGRMRNFFGILNKIEKKDLAVCGGAVRDWYLLREPKDIDIVAACPMKILHMLGCNFKHTRSQFNGFMFDVSGVKVDLWRLQDSWIFSQGDQTLEKTWERLLQSFPFNIDRVLVFADGRVLQDGFFDGLNRREIELVNPYNKNPEINIVKRGLKFKEKYGFKLGPKLQEEIDKHIQKRGMNYKELLGAKQQCEGSSN